MTKQSLDHRAVLLVVAVSLAAAATVAAQQDRGTWVITDQAGQVTEREPLEFTTVDVPGPVPIVVETEVLATDPGILVELSMTSGAYTTTRQTTLSGGPIQEFFRDAKGRQWIRNNDGSLAYQDGSDWVYVSPGMEARQVAAAPDGSIWSINGPKVSRVAVSGITVYELDSLVYADLFSIAAAPNGDVWAVGGTYRRGDPALLALRFDGSNWWEYGSVPGLRIQAQP